MDGWMGRSIRNKMTPRCRLLDVSLDMVSPRYNCHLFPPSLLSCRLRLSFPFLFFPFTFSSLYYIRHPFLFPRPLLRCKVGIVWDAVTRTCSSPEMASIFGAPSPSQESSLHQSCLKFRYKEIESDTMDISQKGRDEGGGGSDRVSGCVLYVIYCITIALSSISHSYQDSWLFCQFQVKLHAHVPFPFVTTQVTQEPPPHHSLSLLLTGILKQSPCFRAITIIHSMPLYHLFHIP